MGTTFEEKPLDVSPFFSEDIQIKENQEKAEEFKIHEAIKNIVNGGDWVKDKMGEVEWEKCNINYRPVLSTMHTAEAFFVLGKIIMKDGTVLYESEMRSHQVDGVNNKRVRYTTQFRNGKWVERLLKYSENISRQYQEELNKKEQEAHEKKMKPFSEIDF
jgi:hypothetical protein